MSLSSHNAKHRQWARVTAGLPSSGVTLVPGR